MINFNYELDFSLDNSTSFSDWINRVLISENHTLGEVNYIFCDDEYLLNINKQYLNHDYYTDIITFDYVENNVVSGDIFVSIDRIRENAISFNVAFIEELKRVISHGILHLCGYGDKSEEEAKLMRLKENEKISMFHVER